MSGHAELPVPEPDLTPEAVIERARALIPAIRDQQDKAERQGHHTAELDRKFTEAGFYRILRPAVHHDRLVMPLAQNRQCPQVGRNEQIT